MCVRVCPTIDALRFLAECRRKRLNHGSIVAVALTVAVDFPLSVLDSACFLRHFFSGFCMFCLVDYVISISATDYLGRFVSEMTGYVSSGTLNLTN